MGTEHERAQNALSQRVDEEIAKVRAARLVSAEDDAPDGLMYSISTSPVRPEVYALYRLVQVVEVARVSTYTLTVRTSS